MVFSHVFNGIFHGFHGISNGLNGISIGFDGIFHVYFVGFPFEKEGLFSPMARLPDCQVAIKVIEVDEDDTSGFADEATMRNFATWGWVKTYSITIFWGNKHP